MKYGILLICIAMAVLSFLIDHWINDPKEQWNRIKIVFYFTAYIFVVALFQCITEGVREPFLDCFTGAGVRTFFLYSVILLPCAVIAPFVLRKLLGQRADAFAYHAAFCSVTLFFAGYAVMTEAAVLLLCAVIFIGWVYALVYVLRVQETGSERMGLKQKAGMVLPGVLWAGITYVLYIPNQVVLSNLAQVPIKYTAVLAVSFVLFAAFCLFFVLAGMLLPDGYASMYAVLFFGLTLCGYIQNNFLNKNLSLLDGDQISASKGAVIGNYACWLILLAAVCVLCALFKKKAHVWCRNICYLFCITQIVAFAAALLTADYGSQHTEVLTTQYMTEFAKDSNVVVFILDRYDEQFLDLVTEEDPDFLAPLSDFTHYRNMISEYGHTYMVLPYILSGMEWPEKMPEEEYAKYAADNAFMLDRVKDMGYACDVYSKGVFTQKNIGRNIRNWSDNVNMSHTFGSFWKLWNKISRYSTLPYGIAEYFYYTAYDIEAVAQNGEKYVWGNDTVWYQCLEENGLTVNTNLDKLFKVIHMYGAHSPFYMNEQFEYLPDAGSSLMEQSRASMEIVYRYIEAMKEKNIYDQATIIIMADHGQSAMHKPETIRENGFDYVSVPILFVKEPGETSSAARESSAPVTLHEMVPTLLRSMGDASYQAYGRCFDEVPEDEERTRYFHFGNPPKIPYVTFQIDGNARDERCWKIIEFDEGS